MKEKKIEENVKDSEKEKFQREEDDRTVKYFLVKDMTQTFYFREAKSTRSSY